MTVFAKDNTFGLEVPVDRMQEILNDELSWIGINNIYGIIYRNSDGNNIIPEAWTETKDYKPIFNNDKVTSEIGFLEVSRDINTNTAIVDIIFTLNLVKAYNQSIRDNERAYIEAKEIIKNYHQITDFKRGVPNVFSGFRTDNIKYLDMQPYDVFSYSVIMAYPDNKLCTTLSA